MSSPTEVDAADVDDERALGETNEDEVLTPRGLVTGTLQEFWLAALLSLVASVFGILIAHTATRRRASRWGSLLGGGLSIIVLGIVLAVIILADVLPVSSYGLALLPLAGAGVAGPLCVYRGMTGWMFLANRSQSRLDIVILVVVVAALIVLIVASLLRMMFQGLLQAM